MRAAACKLTVPPDREGTQAVHQALVGHAQLKQAPEITHAKRIEKARISNRTKIYWNE